MGVARDGTNLLILSDFNADLLARLINNDLEKPAVNSETNGARKVMASLIDGQDPLWQDRDAAFIWAQPHEISETFARALEMQSINHDEVISEMEAFCEVVLRAKSRVRAVFVASLQMPWSSRGYGLLDLREGLGVRSLLARMNAHLRDRLGGAKGIYVLDSTSWLQVNEPYADKMWFLTKAPFNTEVLRLALRDVKAAVRGLSEISRKVVICDLDDTLWGGVVGDDGWQNLRLGGHDGLGEALVAFQRELKALTRRGVLLAIVSKNTESVAFEAIESHPEMVLRKKDFAAWRINWGDKADNVVSLLRELNLGLESAVFLDDSPIERARVAAALPGVLVPDMPAEKMLYPEMLRGLECFDTPVMSEEDRSRALMYSTNRERLESLPSMGDSEALDKWLPTLELRVVAMPMEESNIKRTVQLLNKTNQMNLRTRRLTEEEFSDWAHESNRTVWTFRVRDKFGDSGLTGIASFELGEFDALLCDFILSCRVMGKKIEETMAHVLTESARQLGASRLVARYEETDKNQPCLEFWRRSGFREESRHTFVWDLGQAYAKPGAVTLKIMDV